MSPTDKKTTKKTTRKPKPTKKLSKAEKLKAKAERLLVEAAAALDEEEDEEETVDDSSSEVVDVEFANAGSFDRESGIFSPGSDYKRFFRSVDFKEMKQKHFARLAEKDDFEWFIIATDVTKAKGQDGIFMRLSKSGESFIFYINERLFCIPISHIESEEFDSIGLSEVTFN